MPWVKCRCGQRFEADTNAALEQQLTGHQCGWTLREIVTTAALALALVAVCAGCSVLVAVTHA